MKKAICHRCAVLLGMLAMLGAVLSVPASAFADIKAAAASHAMADGGMPCHQKPCPKCPQSCPDMAAGCVAKCSQAAAPLSLPRLVVKPARVSFVPLAYDAERAGTLIPPLLRPPIL